MRMRGERPFVFTNIRGEGRPGAAPEFQEFCGVWPVVTLSVCQVSVAANQIFRSAFRLLAMERLTSLFQLTK